MLATRRPVFSGFPHDVVDWKQNPTVDSIPSASCTATTARGAKWARPVASDPTTPAARKIIRGCLGALTKWHWGQCTPTGQPFKPSSWAYDPALPAPAQNNGRVADELRAANLPGGFQFKAVVSGVGTFLPSIAQTVQSMVAAEGINMTVEPLPPAQLLQTYSTGGADAYYSTQSGGADPSAIISRLTTSLSPGGTPNEALTRLASQGAETSDQARRQDSYRSWSAEYQTEAFHVSICNQDVLFAHTPNVSVKTFTDPLTVDPRGMTINATPQSNGNG